jgi:O-antigen ligase
LRAWLLPALLLYVASAFVLPKGNGSAIVFYAAVLPCLIAALAQRKPIPWRDPAVALSVGLIVWSGLTLLWGEGGLHRAGQFAADTVATLGFLLAMVLTLGDATAREKLARLLVVLGCANALFAIAWSLAMHPHDPRLHGWGNTMHAILGAMVMATAYLTALARGLSGRHARWPNLAAAAVMGAFILMTESRGPILGAGVATVFLCAAGAWRWRALAALAALAAAWYALPHTLRDHGTQALVRRGTSHRLEIWTQTFGLIREHPLVGHGLGAQMHMQMEDVLVTFPHDLYLSLLYYSGAIGLLLFMAMAATLAGRLLRAWDADAPWLAAMGIAVLLGGLTDLGQVTKGPGPMWLILWIPVGIMIGWWQSQPAAIKSAAAPAPAGRPAASPPA